MVRVWNIVALSFLIISTSPVGAETTLSVGQPLCTTMDNLHEYLLAALKKDRTWLSQIEGCAMLKGGLKMEVIDRGDTTSGMHIDKVRVFSAKGSAVGYTMNIDP